MQCQEKFKDTERLQRENAKLTFANEQQKAELQRKNDDCRSKDINLRGFDELAKINHELNVRNAEMVSKVNNLQSKLDLVDEKDKESALVAEKVTKIEAERDAAKSENEKLRVIVRKKI